MQEGEAVRLSREHLIKIGDSECSHSEGGRGKVELRGIVDSHHVPMAAPQQRDREKVKDSMHKPKKKAQRKQ